MESIVITTMESILEGDVDKVDGDLARLLFVNRKDSDEYKNVYENDPLSLMEIMRLNGPRQVCQYQFKKNDIVWICRTCQRGILLLQLYILFFLSLIIIIIIR